MLPTILWNYVQPNFCSIAFFSNSPFLATPFFLSDRGLGASYRRSLRKCRFSRSCSSERGFRGAPAEAALAQAKDKVAAQARITAAKTLSTFMDKSLLDLPDFMMSPEFLHNDLDLQYLRYPPRKDDAPTPLARSVLSGQMAGQHRDALGEPAAISMSVYAELPSDDVGATRERGGGGGDGLEGVLVLLCSMRLHPGTGRLDMRPGLPPDDGDDEGADVWHAVAGTRYEWRLRNLAESLSSEQQAAEVAAERALRLQAAMAHARALRRSVESHGALLKEGERPIAGITGYEAPAVNVSKAREAFDKAEAKVTRGLLWGFVRWCRCRVLLIFHAIDATMISYAQARQHEGAEARLVI